MALVLDNAQTNDAKILYLTDMSTWGTGGVPSLRSVTSAVLTVAYRTSTMESFSDEVTIPVTDVFTAANGDPSLLVFPIVFTNAPALSTSLVKGDALPDGIWKIQYTINDTVTFESPMDLLLDNVIRSIIYKKLATIPMKYLCSNNFYTSKIDDIVTIKALHWSMEAGAYVAQQSNLLDILETLQRQTA